MSVLVSSRSILRITVLQSANQSHLMECKTRQKLNVRMIMRAHTVHTYRVSAGILQFTLIPFLRLCKDLKDRFKL